jgi:seryl-tRNA synthetase
MMQEKQSSIRTQDRFGELRDRLFDAELLFPTGVDGLYGRSGVFQGIADAVDRMVQRWGDELDATSVHLPPVVARTTFDATDYYRSFPDLMGSVHVFHGEDRDHAELVRRVEDGGDWPALLEPGEIVLSPAACHGLYPMCRGRMPAGGRYYDVSAYCFRHEPSVDPVRMQAFSQHEIVYVGEPEGAQRHRDEALAHGLSLLRGLGLDVEPVAASDPFFGRLGKALAAGQLEEGLKTEGVTQIHRSGPPTAILSVNYHRDHFALPFDIETATGDLAHTSCVGFGVDRVTIALLARHGFDPSRWPESVRAALFSPGENKLAPPTTATWPTVGSPELLGVGSKESP